MEKGKTNAALGSFAKKLDAYFGITASGSSLKTELIAGAATFMTMCYILVVNAGMIGGTLLGDGGFRRYIATALSAIFGTLMLGLFIKLPFAQARAWDSFLYFLGLSRVGRKLWNGIVYRVDFRRAVLCVVNSGIREKIMEGLPGCIKLAISAGIGAFIAFIGFQNAKIIVDDPATLVKLVDFTQLFKTGAGQGVALNAIVCVATFLGIVVMSKKNIKASIILGLLGGSVLYYLLQLIVFKKISEDLSLASPFAAFGAFGSKAFFKFEVKGLFTNFKAFMNFVSLVIAFAIVDMFDTIGTLVGTCTRAGMMDKDGNVPNNKADKRLRRNMVGAVLGSTVTIWESAAGVSAGGRTGFTSVVVAALFFIAMFLSPIASLIPGPAAAAALIYVGVLMMSSVKEIDWHDPAVGACCLMTVLGMPLTYSISNGIGLGIITYVVVKAVTGKIKDVKLFTYIIAAIFLLKFFVVG